MELFKNKYVFVVATPKSEKESHELPFVKYGVPDGIEVDIVYNNTTGLSEVYNGMMKKWKGYKIVFCHDDVEIHDRFISQKLDIAFTMYDIVGLAGSKEVLVKNPPMWHLMARKDKLTGFVSHYFGNNEWVSSYYGRTPARTVLLDGLFLAVDSDKMIDNGVWFDDDFDFHFYDLAFCLRAFEKKMKLGTYPIFVVHHGLGEPDDNFYDLADKFVKKYPLNSYFAI